MTDLATVTALAEEKIVTLLSSKMYNDPSTMDFWVCWHEACAEHGHVQCGEDDEICYRNSREQQQAKLYCFCPGVA